MTNEIFTRIQLKYDSYANWTSNNPTLLAGEVAIAKLVSDVTIPTDADKNAPVLFKVGPGAFNSLPWASALAADVYSWAKAKDVRLNGQKLEFYTDGTVVKEVDLSTFATEAEVTEILKGYKKVQTAVADPTANGKSLTFIDTISQDTQGVITATKKNVNLDDYALKSEIPTELGVMSVAKKDGTAIEVDNTDAKNPKIGFAIDSTAGDVTLTQTNSGLKATLNKTAAGLNNVENKSTATIKTEFTGAVADGNTGFVTGDAVHDAIATAVEELTVGAHVYAVTAASDSVDVNTTTAGNKTTFDVDVVVPDMLSGLPAFENRVRNTDWGIYSNQDVSMTYDASTMTYTLYQQQESNVMGGSTLDYDHTYKVEIGKITIPKDMVVKSGTVVTKDAAGAWGEAGTYIELELQNVENPIYINVGNLIEYVTSGSKTGDMVVVNIDDDHKVTATITDGTITKAKLDTAVKSSLNKADSAVQTVTAGTANGTISVDGNDVAVTGLGDAAYVQYTQVSFDIDDISSNSNKYDEAINGTFVYDQEAWGSPDSLGFHMQLGLKKGSVPEAALDTALTTKINGAVQEVVTGDAAGTIKVDGTDVAVNGLGSAAYTESSTYATAVQGAKADRAISSLQEDTVQNDSDFIAGALVFGQSTGLGEDGKDVSQYVNIKKGGIVTDALADNAVTTAKLQGARKSTGTDNTTDIIIFNCGTSTTVI